MSFDLPALPEEWQFLPLEKCAVPASISYGVVQPGTPTNMGVPIIRVNNFSDGRLDLSDVMRIAPEVESKYTRTRLSGGEVLLTLVGSVGQVAEVPLNCAGFNVARAVGVIRPANGLESKWLAICLRSPLSQQLLGSRANTTVQTTINLKDVRALPVPIPPAAERAQISEMVGTLDDRIALLRETNATLEAIAQALFKSWFVDFDPVRAKSQGLVPAGMDEATAALFPDSFEESALGLVPKGWRQGTISDFAQMHRGSVNPGGSGDTLFEHYSLPAFDAGQMPVREAGAEIKSNKTSVPRDAVLLSKLNPHIPRVWLPFGAGPHAVCSTEFLVFVPTLGVSREFAYCSFVSAPFQERLRQLVTGTSNSHQRVKPEGVATLSTVVPPRQVVVAFTSVVQLVFERVGRNRCQAQTLATLRDTLLPRLISGQLRLPDAAVQITEACA
jgi:type I restriction enzyme S subunit